MTSLELDVGITEFASTSTAHFTGILKHRFKDFQVNEIDLKGEVASILSEEEEVATASHAAAATLDDAKINELSQAFSLIAGENNMALLHQLLIDVSTAAEREKTEAKSLAADDEGDLLTALLENIGSKEARKAVHFFFKEPNLYSFTTETEGEGQIRVTWDPNGKSTKGGQKRGQRGDRNDPKGTKGQDYVRFVLWKENLDTQVAIGIIAKALHTSASNFGMAGTKDKRGCTSQFLTAHRIDPHKLKSLNARLRSMLIGIPPQHYCQEHLQLGALQGNEFKIMMRNVKAQEESVDVIKLADESCSRLAVSGFVNYFGLQRFGTGGTATHIVGSSMLRGEMEATCRLILAGQDDEREDVKEARAAFNINGDAKKALQLMPRWATAERSILEALGSGAGSNESSWAKALKSIPRTLKMMYLHAWQSRLWNLAASHRIRAFGSDGVVEGDLVLLNGSDEAGSSSLQRIKSVHVVSKEEAEEGRWGIESVVLPLPGSKVLYPKWAGGFEVYRQAASEDRFDLPQPIDLSAGHGQGKGESKGDEFSFGSLGGDYRYLLIKPKSLEWKVIKYSDPNDDTLMESDFELVKKGKQEERSAKRQKGAQEDEPKPPASGDLLGLKLIFKLPASSYATMLIRELTRESTSKSFQSKLSAATKTEDIALGAQEEI